MTLYLKAALFAVEYEFENPQDILNNTRKATEAIDNGIAVLWDFLTSQLFISIC